MKIVLVGAGKVGYFLAKELHAKGYKVTVIDIRDKSAAEVANDLGIETSCGDGSTVQVLTPLCKDTDVFVALTGKDETNVIACQIAKKVCNVPITIARINNPRNNEIVSFFGVDKHFCGTDVFVDLVENEIEFEGMRIVTKIENSDHVIVEFKLSVKSTACFTTLAQYNFVKDSKVVVITSSDGNTITPQGDTIMYPGDDILMVCPKSALEDVWKVMVKP